MDPRLTEGAILKITTEFVDDNYKPILQVIDLKQIHTQRGGGQVTERYRVVISDGSHTAQGILSTQQNFLVQQGHLQKGSFVCLNQFICTTIQGRMIIIIVLLDVLVNKCDIIGQAARFSNALSSRTRLVDQTTETIISEPYSLPAMDARLTEGAILKITTEYFDDNYKPILQVIDLKQIHTHGGGQVTERYRVAVSDGSHTEQGMLATQQNFLVQQGHLQKGSVVRLKQFTCPTIQGRKIILIVVLDVLVDKCDIIGQAARFSNALSPRTRLVDQTTETIISEPYSLPAMDARLTEGAILNITTEYFDDNYKPILQVIDLKQIHTHGGGQVTERYRVAVSDGYHTEQGMLATQQNFLVQQGHLQKGSVVRLNQFTCTTIQGRKIIIIISLNVLVDKCDIIGQAAGFSNALSQWTILIDQTTEQFGSLGL
ncbi:putative nucleic acid-binding protein [Rosa chinensis]|uniref:Putative nucleic acid-binding protein n=1 Tax=Rosa chinensis TaxID=74649 RepID=A0A2P6P9K9_ROSCH|nr:uncharacterized protein LOC112175411 [Rosa chinensis]XP_024168853.1 uncharacterized protein LOC112175411 [Rosa chinensis]PRQ18608.1 putative nucleic acid-binding protein [Rosa chinensis]